MFCYYLEAVPFRFQPAKGQECSDFPLLSVFPPFSGAADIQLKVALLFDRFQSSNDIDLSEAFHGQAEVGWTKSKYPKSTLFP